MIDDDRNQKSFIISASMDESRHIQKTSPNNPHNTNNSPVKKRHNKKPSDGALTVESEDRKVVDGAKLSTTGTSNLDVSVAEDIPSRVFQILFSNAKRGIDELAAICEEERLESSCERSIQLLKDSLDAFTVQAAQIKSEIDFVSGKKVALQVNIKSQVHSHSLSSEVSTPTHNHFHPHHNSTTTSVDHKQPQKLPPKPLRATADPFSPSMAAVIKAKVTRSDSMTSNCSVNEAVSREIDVHNVLHNGGTNSGAASNKPAASAAHSQPTSAALTRQVSSSTVSSDAGGRNRAMTDGDRHFNNSNAQKPTFPTMADHSISAANSPRPAHSKNKKQLNVSKGGKGQPLQHLNQHPNQRIGSIDSWEQKMESDLQQAQLAREEVWRKAEDLADAACAAEERQWVSLGLFSQNRSQQHNQRQSARQAHSGLQIDASHPLSVSPLSFVLDGDYEISSPSDRKHGVSLLTIQQGDGSSQPPSSEMSTPTLSRHSSFSYNNSPYFSNTPNGTSFLSPAPSSASRALHNKLSSPDRRKNFTPDELRRRNEAKQSNAEVNRDLRTAEKIDKARVASERTKAIAEKEQLKKVQQSLFLEDKQAQADKRRSFEINRVKGRAGNENAKVEEVNFINALNSEAIADELNRKLVEAEARVLAAENRRNQRLEDISFSARNRNSRKVQQMSELKMEQERLKMERFEKLQQKLKSVEDRKKERLDELRRRDEQATTNSNNKATAAAAATVEKEEAPTAETTNPSTTTTIASAKNNQNNNNNKNNNNKKSTNKPVPASTPAIAVTAGDKKSRKNKKKKEKSALLQAESSSATADIENVGASLEIDVPNAVADCVSDTMVSEQCIAECYQSTQTNIGKKVTIAARSAYVDAVLAATTATEGCSTSVSVARDDLKLTNLLNLGGNSDSYKLSGKYHTLASQLLGAGTPITINTSLKSDRSHSTPHAHHSPVPTAAVSVANDSSADTTAPTATVADGSNHSTTQSDDVLLLTPSKPVPVTVERQVKFNISLVLCTVNTDDDAAISHFVADGGVALLRVLLGYEVGVLSSAVTFNEILNCSVDPTLGKSLGYIIFDLIRTCASTTVGRNEIFSSGVSVLLADVVSILYAVQETLCRDTAHFQKYTDSVVEYVASQQDKNKDTAVRFPYCVNVLLPLVAATVAAVVVPVSSELVTTTTTTATSFANSNTGTSAENSGASSTAASQSSDTKSVPQVVTDAYLWYLFSSPVFAALGSSIRSDVQCLQYRQSYDYKTTASGTAAPNVADYKQYHSAEAKESVISNALLLTAIAKYLRSGASLPTTATTSSTADKLARIATSIVQLSPTHSSHAKGRTLLSLLRRSEAASTLCSLVHSLVLEFVQDNQRTAALAASAAATLSSTVKKTRRGYTVDTAAYNTSINSNSVTSITLSASQLRVFSALIEALHSLATVDVSLIQQLNKEQQIMLVNSANFLLRSYVISLDDGNVVNVFQDSSPTSPSSQQQQQQFTKAHAEESIRKLLMTMNLACLRCADMQRECGSVTHVKPLFTPPIQQSHASASDSSNSSSGSNNSNVPVSLLLTLCRLSNKFYKEKKFKHCLLPCLLAMTLDVDANISVLRAENKLTTVVKYLEYYLLDLNKLLAAVSSSGGGSGSGSGKSDGESVQDKSASVITEHDKEVLSSAAVDILSHISHLFPTDTWSTALVTYSAR